MTKRQASLDLLKATHEFPTTVMLKVIGRNEDGFEQRVVAAAQQQLGRDESLSYRVRTTAGGRYIAVTMEPYFESAEEVLDAYACIQKVAGVLLLL